MTVKMLTNYISNSLVALGYEEYEDENLINLSLYYCQSAYVRFDPTSICSDTVMAVAKRLLGNDHKDYVDAIEKIITSGKYIDMVIGGKSRADSSCISLTALQSIACEALCDCVTDELRGLEASFKRDGFAFYDANTSDTEIIYDRKFGNFKIQVTKEHCEDLYLFHDPDNNEFNLSQMRRFIEGDEMYFDSVITLLECDPGTEDYSMICQNTISSVVCDKSLSGKKLFHSIYREYVEMFHELISEGRMIMGVERPERDAFYLTRIENAVKQQKERENFSFWDVLKLA